MRVNLYRNERGFTLLELLISMAMLGMIALIVGGAIRMGVRSAESGQKKIDSIERFRTSFNIIESQLQSAFAIRRAGIEYDEDFAQFVGDRNSMQFRSVYSLLGGAKGPVEVSYVIRERPDGRKTIFGSENLVVYDEPIREIMLIDGASDIYFEYYEKSPTDEKGKWTSDWNSKENRQKLPEKVRISVDEDGRLFSLIIQLKTVTPSTSLTTGPLRKPKL